MKKTNIIYFFVCLLLFVLINSCTSRDSEFPFEDFTTESLALGAKGIPKETETLSRMQTEQKLIQAVGGGILLLFPLIEESDPGLFVMAVANDSSLQVDRLYLLDSKQSFSYENIFSIDSLIYYVNNEEEPFQVVVSKNDIQKTYNIDTYMYRRIQRIIMNQFEYPANPVNLRIPIVKK